jgi:hypothetical protein
VWEKIRHADDDPLGGEIFELLSELDPDTDLGLALNRGTLHEVAASEYSDHFGRVLDYLCHQLQIPVPEVHVEDGLGGLGARPSRALCPQLLVSQSLLEERDHLTLAAALGRVLPFFWAGRTFAAVYGTPELKSLVMATMLLVAPKLKIPDPNNTIGSLRDRLASVSKDLQDRLAETIVSLTKQRSTLNVGRWFAGVHASALRLAAAMTGDLKPILDLFDEKADNQSVVELITFALSEDHFSVRELLGLSVAV